MPQSKTTNHQKIEVYDIGFANIVESSFNISEDSPIEESEVFPVEDK
jgi:hypothetical protein